MSEHLVINCEKRFKLPGELDYYLSKHDVKTLYFVYWRWKVPQDKLLNYRCIGFHTGPLLEGKGKGGSPIQNLQKIGVKWTTLCAFEMNQKFDEGRILLAVPINIEGSMMDVWTRIDFKIPEMIDYLEAVQPPIPEFFTREMAC